MTGFEIPVLAQLFLFPVVAILIWYFLFSSSNSVVTKIAIEGGYMILGIPLIVFTLLSIPTIALVFWAPSQGLAREVTIAVGAVMIVVTLIAEYYWIKRQINDIEEREGMSFWAYLRKEASSETRDKRRQDKIENKSKNQDYFSDITEMNRQRRELDRAEKEKLRRALLGEIDNETTE